jgi:hypothetical protein
LQTLEQSLCPGPCGQPRRLAWRLNGWYGTHTFTCDACTAMTGEGDDRKDQTYQVSYLLPGAPTDDDPMHGEVVAGPDD